ncbi:MAG: hypothetical protein FWG73_08895 [Planctomycetaceae bacterium]|nr:hypothetical protein [Planctomycetaceae bacterium]
MRRTISIIVCFLMASSYAGLHAQIPENAQFQSGSYGMPYQALQYPTVQSTEIAANNGAVADDSQTEWEKTFTPNSADPAPTPAFTPEPYEVPHLTYVYCHWKRRFHIAPYEPGYAADPSAFPIQTSPLHIWVSSKSSVSQPNPQVPYMSYYDPDPVILPAEIRIRGSRFLAPLTQNQPMPMPVAMPDTAQYISPPAKTRIGDRVRQRLNIGTTFVVQ